MSCSGSSGVAISQFVSIRVVLLAPCTYSNYHARIFLQAQPKQHSSRPNDVTCPLCMYVASKLKEQISDPVTQEDIRAASMAACAALPEGMMRDACTSFVEQYGECHARDAALYFVLY
jgi:hypothetical protein